MDQQTQNHRGERDLKSLNSENRCLIHVDRFRTAKLISNIIESLALVRRVPYDFKQLFLDHGLPSKVFPNQTTLEGQENHCVRQSLSREEVSMPM